MSVMGVLTFLTFLVLFAWALYVVMSVAAAV